MSEKKKPLAGLINFFKEKPLGKAIGSTLIGIGSVIPFTAPFMPSVKAIGAGIGGKDKHDPVAYGSMLAIGVPIAAMILAAILALAGKPEMAQAFLDMAE